jgi:hypothetical protein
LRVTFTSRPSDPTFTLGENVVDVLLAFNTYSSSSISILMLSAGVTPAPVLLALNLMLFNITSSSPDLDVLIRNVASFLSDLRRTVFLALASISRVPAATTLAFTVSSSFTPAGLLSSSSPSSLNLKVL